jgi:hypothetical protein
MPPPENARPIRKSSPLVGSSRPRLTGSPPEVGSGTLMGVLWIVVAQPASESANNAEQTKTNHPRTMSAILIVPTQAPAF